MLVVWFIGAEIPHQCLCVLPSKPAVQVFQYSCFLPPLQSQDLGLGLKWSLSYVERHLGTEALPKGQLIGYLRSQADPLFLRRWRIIGTNKNIKKSHNCVQLLSAYKVRGVVKSSLALKQQLLRSFFQ